MWRVIFATKLVDKIWFLLYRIRMAVRRVIHFFYSYGCETFFARRFLCFIFVIIAPLLDGKSDTRQREAIESYSIGELSRESLKILITENALAWADTISICGICVCACNCIYNCIIFLLQSIQIIDKYIQFWSRFCWGSSLELSCLSTCLR